MMLSVTFAFWGVGTFIPTYVGSVAAKAGLRRRIGRLGRALITSVCGVAGFISLGFIADAFGRRADGDAVLFDVPDPDTGRLSVGARLHGPVARAVGVFGFFTLGIWAWAPIWLPELFPTRMRATAVAFCFNAPRFISCIGPLIAGTLIVTLGGYGPAATIVGLFFILGLVVAPFLPETNGKPLPENLAPAVRG